MPFAHLKVGDRVDRYHGDGFFMEMEIVEIKDHLLVCAAVLPDNQGLVKGGWTFDINTGAEEDVELEWGVSFGRTGTYLKLKE
jgi:hypothetical protein